MIKATAKDQQEINKTIEAIAEAELYSIPFAAILETYRQANEKWGEHTISLAAVYELGRTHSN